MDTIACSQTVRWPQSGKAVRVNSSKGVLCLQALRQFSTASKDSTASKQNKNIALEEVRVQTLKVQHQESDEVVIDRILTPTTWKCLKELNSPSRWFRFNPFTWDAGRNAPVVARKLSFWRWHVVSAVVFYVLVLTRLAQVTIVRPASIMEQIFAFFMTIWFSVFMVFQVHAASRREMTVCWMRGFLLFTKTCEGNVDNNRLND